MKQKFFNVLLVLALTLALVGAVQPATPAQALTYSVHLFGTVNMGGTDSNLVELDATTGALISTIGSVGYSINGLDYDPVSGKLYATTSVKDDVFPCGLLEVDMTTGAGTPIGSGMGCYYMSITNIRADASGTLYAWDESYDDLTMVNPVTGVATVLGDSGISTSAYGMSFDASNTLYFVNAGDIYTVDTGTGAATDTGVSFSGLAHHGDFNPLTGEFWGIGSNGTGAKNINVVDVSTGAINQTLPTVDNLHALTFTNQIIYVTPVDMGFGIDYWTFNNEGTGTGAYNFVAGPAPYNGSLELTTTVNTDGPLFFTMFDSFDIDALGVLRYDAYSSTSPANMPSLQFEVDWDSTDANTAWQGRLVFVPNGSYSAGTWYTFDALDDSTDDYWFGTGGAGAVACPQIDPTPCKWSDVVAAFPNLVLWSSWAQPAGPYQVPGAGLMGFKKGSGESAPASVYVDQLMMGNTTYDFEPDFPPTDITLDNDNVDEHSGIGALVGTFTTADLTVVDSHTYSFCGGTDDSLFSISGDQLLTGADFDYDTDPTSYSVCIRTTDNLSQTYDETFTIYVNNVNTAPVAVDDGPFNVSHTGSYSQTAPGLLGNDTDADGDTLTVAGVTIPAAHFDIYGVFNDGSFSYDPVNTYVGLDSFTYYVTDGLADSNTATVSFNVTNAAPVASADSGYSTGHAVDLIGATGLFGNDTDADGDALAAYEDSDPPHGSVTVYTNGSFDYYPDGDYEGLDCFSYHVEDYVTTIGDLGAGTEASNSAEVCVNVTNAAPVTGFEWYFMMTYDTLIGNVLDNDSDPDGDPLTASLINPPISGSTYFDFADTGDFTFIPPSLSGHFISDFEYAAHDPFTFTQSWAWIDVFSPVQESDITVHYNGWQGYEDKGASNGTYRANNEKGGSFTFAPNYKFKGFTLYTYRGPDQGKVRIFLDGKYLKTVDLYRAAPQWGYAIPLTFLNGKHTIRVENLGIPKGKFVRMDYAKVNTNSGKFTLEDTDSAITWGVDLWKTYKNAEALGGSYRKSTLNKARVEHDFFGERIDWVTMTGPNLGIAKVIIDGTVVGMVDLYSATPVYQVIFTYDGLSVDFHRIRIEATGTHSGGSTGNAIVVDAFGSFTIFDTCKVLADVKDAAGCLRAR
jgi:hypothetical protein